MKDVFISMPFEEAFDKVYEWAIKQAISNVGLNPYRVDEVVSNSKITANIEDGIKLSSIFIADVTHKNPNVYYEVGLAKAMGKILVIVTQNEEDVTFDLRQWKFILYNPSAEGLEKFKAKLVKLLTDIVTNYEKYDTVTRVFMHGTKFTVPNGNEFWNDLFRKAETKFYLVGGTNKSWINKGVGQSKEMADSILRIIKNGGLVRLISNDDDSVIQTHKDFINTYVRPNLKGKKAISLFNKNFFYGVVETNYQAVISDSRIVLLPTMNSTKFKDESLVLEFEGDHLAAFKNYLADIERLISEKKCKKIDIGE